MSFRASAIDIPRTINKKTKHTPMYLQNDMCWYSCASAQHRSDVLLLPCSPEQYAKLLSNPLYSNLYFTNTPQNHENDISQNSLVDYMKCYMSSSSDEDNDVFQYSDDDDNQSLRLSNPEDSGSITLQLQDETEEKKGGEEYEDNEEKFEFDGIFKMDCPITAKICENVALSLLQNYE